MAVRLTVWNACAAFALLLGVTAFFYWGLAAELREDDDETLREQIQIFRGLLLRGAGTLADLKGYVESRATVSESPQIYLRIVDARGDLISETAGMGLLLPARVFPVPVGVEAQGDGVPVSRPAGRAFRVMAAAARIGGASGDYAVIQAAVDHTRDQSVLRKWRNSFAIALCVSGLLSWALARRITRRGMRPLFGFVEATHRIRSSALTGRVALEDMPSELAELATNFNHMLDRLEESFIRLSHFSANIAHELRRPLNVLRGQAEVALSRTRSADEYREVLASNLEECVNLSRIIDHLLFVARVERSETSLERERCDLMPELESILAYYQPLAAEKGVGLRLEGSEDLSAEVDRVLFRRAVGNLLSNALASTPAGGNVMVSVVRSESGLCIEVRDTGVGIAPEHLPHLFDRFYRPSGPEEGKRGGVGLGLSIVKTIMDLHGGSVRIESELGQGTRALLVFQPPKQSP